MYLAMLYITSAALYLAIVLGRVRDKHGPVKELDEKRQQAIRIELKCATIVFLAGMSLILLFHQQLEAAMQWTADAIRAAASVR